LLRQNGNSRTGFGLSNDYGVRVFAPHDVQSAGSLFGVGKNNGTTYSGDLLTVQYDGKVGIGTASPNAELHISGAHPHMDIGPDGSNVGKMGFRYNNLYLATSSSTGEIFFKNNTSSNGAPDANGVVLGTFGLNGLVSPLQPAFVATNSASQSVGSDAKISFTSAGVNVGSNFSTANDRFTAPVSGRYFFNFTASISNMSSTGTYLAIYFKKNGAGTSHRFRTRAEDVGNEWTGITGTAIMDLSSGDYIEANGYNDAGNFTMQGGEYLFGGYLIG
jgi:hypothetical protein